jgi:aminodeoxyfutalosine synthase
MEPRFDDSRLTSIAAKVTAGQRLSLEDGVTLYRSPDILGVGYLANLVRERLHGDTTYFNVNRHINPTDCAPSASGCATPKPTPCRSRKSGNAPAKATAKR